MSTPVTPLTNSELRNQVAFTRVLEENVTVATPPPPPGSVYLNADMATAGEWKGGGKPSARIEQSEIGAKWEMEPVRRGFISAFVAFMVVSFVYFLALSDTVQGLLFTFLALLSISGYFAISIPSGDAFGSKKK